MDRRLALQMLSGLVAINGVAMAANRTHALKIVNGNIETLLAEYREKDHEFVLDLSTIDRIIVKRGKRQKAISVAEFFDAL